MDAHRSHGLVGGLGLRSRGCLRGRWSRAERQTSAGICFVNQPEYVPGGACGWAIKVALGSNAVSTLGVGSNRVASPTL